MITLDNCQEWLEQQPERLIFIQLIWQDDGYVRQVTQLVKSEMPKEQWNRTVDQFANREIHKIVFENVDGKPDCWVYFKDTEASK